MIRQREKTLYLSVLNDGTVPMKAELSNHAPFAMRGATEVDYLRAELDNGWEYRVYRVTNPDRETETWTEDESEGFWVYLCWADGDGFTPKLYPPDQALKAAAAAAQGSHPTTSALPDDLGGMVWTNEPADPSGFDGESWYAHVFWAVPTDDR